ncbi:MAG TPA: PLDc N-terminal domain-containing protein [Actinomycetota bacterium]
MEWLFVGAFGLFWIGGIALWIFALVDCIRVQDDSMYRSGTKLIWIIVIVLTQVIGAIIYLVIGRPELGTGPPAAGMPPPPPPPTI